MSLEVPPMSKGMRSAAPRSSATPARGGDAAGRPRQHGAGRHADRLLDRGDPSVRLHDEDRSFESGPRQPVLEVREIPAD